MGLDSSSKAENIRSRTIFSATDLGKREITSGIKKLSVYIRELTRMGGLLGIMGVGATSLACSSLPEKYISLEPPKPLNPLGVFVNDELFGSTVMDGCGVWEEEGVTCFLAADEETAHVYVKVVRTPCHENPDGNILLAETNIDHRTIDYFQACTVDDVSSDPTQTFAHELGHLFGINFHPPTSSNDLDSKLKEKIMVDAEGPLVGLALMNARAHVGMNYETFLDHRAFDLRNQELSVLSPMAK